MTSTEQATTDQEKGGKNTDTQTTSSTSTTDKPKATATGSKPPMSPKPMGRVRVAPAVATGTTVAAAIAAVQIATVYGPTAGITAGGAFLVLIIGAWFAYKAYRRRLQRTGKKSDKEPKGRGAKTRGHVRGEFRRPGSSHRGRHHGSNHRNPLSRLPGIGGGRGRGGGGTGHGSGGGSGRKGRGLTSLLPGKSNRKSNPKVAGRDRSTTATRSESPTSRNRLRDKTANRHAKNTHAASNGGRGHPRHVAGHPKGNGGKGGALRTLASKLTGGGNKSGPKHHASPVSQHRARNNGNGGKNNGSPSNRSSRSGTLGRLASAAGRGVKAITGRGKRSNPDPSVSSRRDTDPPLRRPRRTAGNSDYVVKYKDGTTSPDRRSKRQKVAGWAKRQTDTAKEVFKQPFDGVTKESIRNDLGRWGNTMSKRWQRREADAARERSEAKGYTVKYKDQTVPTPGRLDTPAKRWADAERAEHGTPVKPKVPPRNAVPNFQRGPVKPLPKMKPSAWASKPAKDKAEERKLPPVSVNFPGKEPSMSAFSGFQAEDSSPEQVKMMLQQTPDELRDTARGLASVGQNAAGTAYQGLDEEYSAIAQAVYSAAQRAEEAGGNFSAQNQVAEEFRENYAHLPGAEQWANPS